MQPTDPTTTWATITAAAEQTEIPHRTLRRWADLGYLPCKRQGRRVLVDVDAIAILRRTLPPPRHAPLRRPLAGPPLMASGLAVSWPEVDLLIDALHDAAELQAAVWAASGRSGALDIAARYSLMGARLGFARDASGAPR
jgi:hypothetical protein